MTIDEAGKPEKQSGPSTRFVLAAGGAAALLVLLAVLTAVLWPEIQLRYHRHYFRHGSPEQQVQALKWVGSHALEPGMSRQQVEHVLGEPLSGRFRPASPSIIIGRLAQLWDPRNSPPCYRFGADPCIKLTFGRNEKGEELPLSQVEWLDGSHRDILLQARGRPRARGWKHPE